MAGLNENVAFIYDDTFSLISLISSGLGAGFAPEWTGELPGSGVVLKKVTGIGLKIGLGAAWSKDDPTAAPDASSTLPGHLGGRAGEGAGVCDTAHAAPSCGTPIPGEVGPACPPRGRFAQAPAASLDPVLT
jgi:hypothetical protein